MSNRMCVLLVVRFLLSNKVNTVDQISEWNEKQKWSTRVTNQFWLRLAGVQENLFPPAKQQHHFHQDTISCLCSERQTPLETIKDSIQHLCLLSFGQTLFQLTETF